MIMKQVHGTDDCTCVVFGFRLWLYSYT